MSTMSEQTELPSLAPLELALDFINLRKELDAFSDKKEWEKLGEGGFSTVYKSYFKQQHKDVALKELKRQVNESEVTVLLKAMTSDQIVDIKAVVRTSSTSLIFSHIAMELLPCDLQTLRNNIKISPERWPAIWPGFVSIMGDICKGLSYLHSHDVHHRDIKPRNILISDSLQAKVSDFGLSRLIGSGSENRGENHLKIILPSGSLPYISPQLLANPEKDFEKEDDVYSFGLLGYKSISNENLFKIESDNVTTAMIDNFKSWVVDNHDRPPEDSLSLYKTPEELRNMISSCWDHEVSKRQSFDHWTNILTAKYDEYSEKDKTSANKRLKTAISGTLEDTVYQASIVDDYELLVQLGLKLDPPSDTYHDWRGLADKLGFPVSDIELIEREKNPTSVVLKTAAQGKKDLSPENLLMILQEMNRQDCAEIINKWQDPKEVESVDIPDSSESFVIEEMKVFKILNGLDVENDLGNDWRALAGKLGFNGDMISKIKQTCDVRKRSTTKSVLTSACQMGMLTSYNQLVKLLTEMKQIHLARNLQQFLKENKISL